MNPDFKTLLEHEESLDPADWQNMKTLAHRMVDDMFAYLEHIGEEPVWRKPPAGVIENLNRPLPLSGEPAEDIYQEFKKDILPYPKGNIHPRFWSWVQGTGTPLSVMAEMLAAGMNSNVAIGDHSAMYVDNQVIDWCKSMLGFPQTGSGILLSGGSMANITALVVARNAYGDGSIRRSGLKAAPAQLVLYASAETHSSVQKAAEVIGLGSEWARKVRVDGDFRMDPDHLRELIRADRAMGLAPFCVIGNAGTVNTGAIDPLHEIAAICRAENLWFHVDGAFGALAKLVPEYREALKPIEEADSLAFDLHKWIYMPYEAGCLLVRDKEAHRSAFALQPNYLLTHERGLAAGPDPITNYGMELSRCFKALKIWMSLKEHGVEKMARLIRQNIAQAAYLADRVQQEPRLELLAPVPMNIVCFRYRPEAPGSLDLNALNKEILMRLHEEGVAAPSYTILNGCYAIRVCIVNHRSRKADFDALVEGVLRIGGTLAASSSS